MLEQKYTATAQNPKLLKEMGALELNIGLLGDEGVKAEALPEEIEAAKTAAKACKKATKKIPALLSKLVVLKVQYGTRGRSECADKDESAATAKDLGEATAAMQEFLEETSAQCLKTEGLDKLFTENAEEATTRAVTLAKDLERLTQEAAKHAEYATLKDKQLQDTLQELYLKDGERSDEQY